MFVCRILGILSCRITFVVLVVGDLFTEDVGLRPFSAKLVSKSSKVVELVREVDTAHGREIAPNDFILFAVPRCCMPVAAVAAVAAYVVTTLRNCESFRIQRYSPM